MEHELIIALAKGYGFNNAGRHCDQCDQIGWIFAIWAIVNFEKLYENFIISTKFLELIIYFGEKVIYLFWQNELG
jgi:hypothetical protein